LDKTLDLLAILVRFVNFYLIERNPLVGYAGHDGRFFWRVFSQWENQRKWYSTILSAAKNPSTRTWRTGNRYRTRLAVA